VNVLDPVRFVVREHGLTERIVFIVLIQGRENIGPLNVLYLKGFFVFQVDVVLSAQLGFANPAKLECFSPPETDSTLRPAESVE